MALVPAGSEQQYDVRSTMSNASAMRGANATEQARRRLKGVMAQKERQCEQMRQTLERKKRLLEEEKREVGALYDAKDADEEAIRRYKEDKLLFRVFKQLDIEKKDSLSIDNIVKRIGGNPDDRLFLDENLFKLLPGSFHFTFRTRQVDKDTLLDVITSNTGVSPLAVEIESDDSHTHGISKITVRLAWHGHPREIAEDPTLPEEENEARRQQVEEYYKSLGGDESSVSEENARAKEQEMVEAVKTHVPAELGWDVVRVTEDHRATFSDFIENFWAIVSPDMMLESLRELYAEARQIEEETILPEEALDRVIEMEHMIKSQQKLGAEIARDCALTEKDISNVDKKIDLVSKELAHIQRVTGYDSTQGAQDHVDFALQQEQITQLGSLVKRLEDEHRRGAALLSKRTAEILTLSERVEENSEIEEQVFKATNDLQVVQRECDQLMEQTRVLMMDHSKTDRAIMVLEGSRDVGAVQSLNSDKQYLQGQIEAHKAAKGESDKAIKAQVCTPHHPHHPYSPPATGIPYRRAGEASRGCEGGAEGPEDGPEDPEASEGRADGGGHGGEGPVQHRGPDAAGGAAGRGAVRAPEQGPRGHHDVDEAEGHHPAREGRHDRGHGAEAWRARQGEGGRRGVLLARLHEGQEGTVSHPFSPFHYDNPNTPTVTTLYFTLSVSLSHSGS